MEGALYEEARANFTWDRVHLSLRAGFGVKTGGSRKLRGGTDKNAEEEREWICKRGKSEGQRFGCDGEKWKIQCE